MPRRTRAKSRTPSRTPPSSPDPAKAGQRHVDERLAKARGELRRERARRAESTAQQAATVAILHAIADVRTDYQPVFDTIVRNAVGVCGAYDASLILLDAGELVLRAHHGPLEALPRQPLSADTVAGRTVLDARAVHVGDLATATGFALGRDFARRLGIGTALGVPLLLDGRAIGVIMIRRAEVRRFTDTQIELLRTFADQAVIAIENVRLFTDVQDKNRTITEALERQTAASEILGVISRSPTDLQPVFDTIIERAVRLCGATIGGLLRFDGERATLVAHHNVPRAELDHLQRHVFPLRAERGSASGRAILDRASVHVHDVLQDREYRVDLPSTYRTTLAVPMLREHVPIGVITLWRREVQPFSDRQVELVQNFADQAVIAIENVRLFTELQASNRGLRETLEQQTATSEILRVISGSPTDVEPTFVAIARAAATLCEADMGYLLPFDGTMIHVGAFHGGTPEEVAASRRAFPHPPSQKSVTARAILTADVVQIDDVSADPEVFESLRMFRTVLSVPMLREGRSLGAITVARRAVRRFTDSQVALLETFADQAVIAIENVRLFTELEQRNAALTEAHAQITEALEQQTATGEILRVISSSPTDIQPVLDRMAESAARFCQAYDATIFRVDGDQLRLMAHHGPISSLPLGMGIPITPGGVATRAVLEGRPIHVPDIRLVEDEYPLAAATARSLGNRTMLAVPLLREGLALGALLLRRIDPDPFTDKQIQLLRIFADQAVIAIENVRLFTELQASNRGLTEALDQQTATGEILRVISSSPTDVQPVFESLVVSAARLCGANDLLLVVLEGDVLRPVAGIGAIWQATSPDLRVPLVRSSVLARAVIDGMTQHFPDLAALSEAEFSVGLALQRRFGHRTVLAVPLIRDGRSLGGIFALRFEVRPFEEQQIALLRTFADQAVIAIENVRLFTELEDKNAALTQAHAQVTEALEQQTATGEILRVISRSPTDVQPVFDAIARSAAQLCEVYDVSIFRVDGDRLAFVAHHGSIAQRHGDFSLPLVAGTVGGRSVLESRTVHVADLQNEDREFPDAVENARRFGFRTILSVPLLREGVAVGGIQLRRTEVQPFSERQVALLQTFADQAVIAIENVRLFTELQASNRELTIALDQQTATAEVLRVISRSQTELQPVFDAICDSASRLCGADLAGVFRLVDGQVHEVSSWSRLSPEFQEMLRRTFPRPVDASTYIGRALLERRIVHVRDMADPAALQSATSTQHFGFRSQLTVPMLRSGEPVGGITLVRREPGFFSDDQVTLLTTFADQAVIAIENSRLLTELQARTAELTRSVEELRALGEVGQAVSSILDLDAVLTTIVARAVELSSADGGSIYEYDEAAEEFTLRATHNLDAENVALRREIRLKKGEGATGGLAVTRTPIQLGDITTEGVYDSRLRNALLRLGTRAVLAVPLLREDHLIGGLVVSRNTPGEFPAQIVQLLQTFATQSALAIQNARLFREIESKSRELEVASQHKSEFLASMSHELRTPLNAVIGFSDVLLQGMFGETNEKQTEYLRDILASGQHLLSLINDILDLSKIEAGRMELDLADFDLPSAIDDALLLMRERAGRRGIAVARRVDEGLGQIHADQRKVKQVLLNLLSNAVKFTPEGGRIDVQATLASDAAEISVIDTGIGIAPEDHEAVFEEFRQVGRADRKAEGTGLGLALCRKFVELHGGRIWVKSELGAGSTFTFSLPLRGAP